MENESRQAIRAARAALDEAIARQDLEAVGRFLLPSYHVVTARSMQRDGRDASLWSWSEMFRRDPGSAVGRTPEEIHVNVEWGMAEEHGRWTGTIRTKDGPMELAGVYAAKWHNTAEGWLLQAEIFTPITVVRS